MTDEELKKLAEEYQEGLRQVEEVQDEWNSRFEGLNEEEFEKELEKQLQEMLEDAKNDPIKIETIKKK